MEIRVKQEIQRVKRTGYYYDIILVIYSIHIYKLYIEETS